MSVEAIGLYILMLEIALMVFGQFALFRRPSLARVYQVTQVANPIQQAIHKT